MNLRDLAPPTDLPVPDARIPGWLVRVALAVLGTALTVVAWGDTGWIAIGITLSIVAALVPDFLLGWLLIVFLAIGQLRAPGTLRWQLLVLVAGVHLVHVLSMLALELPWRGWIQPAVFRAPLLRCGAIQVPAQITVVVAMTALGPGGHGQHHTTVAGCAAIGAAALAGLALLMLSGARQTEGGFGEGELDVNRPALPSSQ